MKGFKFNARVKNAPESDPESAGLVVAKQEAGSGGTGTVCSVVGPPSLLLAWATPSLLSVSSVNQSQHIHRVSASGRGKAHPRQKDTQPAERNS